MSETTDSTQNLTSKPKISLLSATAFSATAMLGSGWLFSSQKVAAQAGRWAFLTWIVAALFIFCVAFCLSKIVAIFPERGILTRSSTLSHNKVFGMPFAFSNWLGIVIVIATEALASTQYLSGLTKHNYLMDAGKLTMYGRFVSFFILSVYLVVNYYGIRFLSKINNAVTIFKIFTPVFVVVCLLIASFDHHNVIKNIAFLRSDHSSPMVIFAAIVNAGLIYAFNGFQISTSFASEVKNARKNVPLAMFFSLIIILVLYLFLQFAFMSALPHTVLLRMGGWQGLNFSSPLLDLTMLLGYHFLSAFILADSVVGPSGTGMSYLGASTRLLTAMSRSGQMPKLLDKPHPIYHFSRRSMLICCFLAALSIYFGDNWSALMVFLTGLHLIGYMAAPVSMGALLPKSWSYKLFGTFVFSCIAVLFLTIPKPSMIVINIALTVLIIIYMLSEKKIGHRKLLGYSSPFLCFLWICYFTTNFLIIIAVACVFYLAITSRLFIKYCKKIS